MDAGGRVTQEAKAEDEGIYKTVTYLLLTPSPQPSTPQGGTEVP